jgi:hypothetical protein
LLRKAWDLALKVFSLSIQAFRKRKFHVTSRCSIAHFVRWTVFKSRFYGFAAQNNSIKPQLKNCR